MKRIVFILILLQLCNLLYSQVPVDFSKAKETDAYPPLSEPTAEKSCGVYSYNPHVTADGYLCVDFYARRFVEWTTRQSGYIGDERIRYTNSLGGFSISLFQIRGGETFEEKFDNVEFILDPAFHEAFPYMCPVKLSRPISMPGTTSQFGVSFVCNIDGIDVNEKYAPKAVIVDKDIPLRLGQLKFRIKGSITSTVKSGFRLVASGTSAYVFTESAADKKISTNYPIVGWLEGEDGNIDIPLTPQAEDTAPETPLLADHLQNEFCQNAEGRFTIKGATLPARATTCDWYVSATPKGVKITDTNQFTLSKDADGAKGCTITWLRAGTYYVNVYSSSGSEYSKDTSSMSVTVRPLPDVKMLVDGASHTTAKIAKCAGTQVVLSATSGLTSYEWEGTLATVTGSSTTQTLANTGTIAIDKKYKVTGKLSGCSASDSVVFTINPLPNVVLSPTTGSYPSGQQLSAVVSVVPGSSDANLQYNWTKPEVKTNGGSTLDFVVKETDPTDIAVTVVNTATTCSKELTGRVTDNGNGLKVKLISLSTAICQNGVGRLKAEISGGTSSYTCSWYLGRDLTAPALATHTGVTGVDYYTVNPAQGLTYTLKVSDGPLVATREITLTVDNSHSAIAVVVPIEIRAAKNSQVVLIADPSSADLGTNTYTWEPTDKLAGASEINKQYPLTAAITADQSYNVIMTNVQGSVTCMSTGTTLVKMYADSETDPLLVSVDPEAITLCKNSTLTFMTTITGAGSGESACEWKPSIGLNNPKIPNPLFTAANVGSTGFKEYTLIVKKNGQTTTKRVAITIVDATAPVLSFADNVYCTDSLLKLNGDDGSVTQFSWTVKNKTTNHTDTYTTTVPQYSIADAGQYTISVMGETANCKTNRVGQDFELRKISLNMQVVPSSYRSGESVVATVTPSGGWGDNDASVYYYTWSKPEALAEVRGKNTNTVAGAWKNQYDFTVKVRDVNNCAATATGSATIQAGGLTLELAQVNAFCTGGSAMMTATAQGGSGKYTYVWKTGATTVQTHQTANNTADSYFAENPADSYEITVTDETAPNALTVTKTITLTKNPANAPIIDAGGPQIAVARANDVAILAAELVSPTKSPYSWQWSGGAFTAPNDAKQQITQSAPITGNTTYSVYAVDANGCISKPDQVSVIINAADNFAITIDAAPTMCASASQQLGVTLSPEQPGATYHWSVAPELTIDNASLANPVVTATQAGSYMVGVTVTVNGVKRTAQKNITVTTDKLPKLELAYVTKCEGDTVTVSNTAVGVTIDNYKWFIGGVYAGMGSKLPLPEGENVVIKVVATSTQSCVASKEDTQSFKAQPVLAWDAASDIQDATTEIDLYIEKTAKVVATPNTVAYSWTKPGVKAGDSYAVTVNNPADAFVEFDVVATDNNTGCKSNRVYKKLTVAKASLEVTPGVLYAVCTGGSAILTVSKIEGGTGPFEYKWKKDGNETILGTDSVYIAQNIIADQKYNVTVTKIGTHKIGVGEITVTPQAGTVPSVTACDDITIVTGNKAALYATSTAPGTLNWNWGPVGDKLSAQEARKQSPQTEILNADQKFGVYVVNGDRCVSRVDSVNVHVVADAPDVLKVEIVPDIELCLGNETKFKAIVTGGSGSVSNCTWLPADMQPVAGNPLMATYVVKKAGKDTITVVVKKGSQTVTAKKEITIRNDQAPKLKFDNLAATKCTGNQLTVSSEVTNVSGDYSWVINGRYAAGNLTNQYTFTQPGNYHVQVIAKGINNCMADTLSKDILITATPQLAVTVEENCGEARLVAVASDATTYTWTPVTATGLGGETLAGKDSIFRVKTNLMSENFEYKVVASNAVCTGVERSVTGTVYGLPDTLILDPYRKSIYPDEQVEITASYTPDLAYNINWTNLDKIENQTGKTIKTKPLTDVSNLFTLTVTNTVESTCKVSNTSIITVSTEDFRIYFDQDTMDICQGIEGEFVAKNMNCKNPPINYTFTSPYPGFLPITQNGVTATQVAIKYTFTQPGKWKLYASGKDASGAVREDSVVVRVNPTPTLDILSPELKKTHSLCQNGGELAVQMKATGTAGWTMNYTLNGTAKTEVFATESYTMKLKGDGSFIVQSIVDSKGCSTAYTKVGFDIKDDVPRLELSSTADITKCQGASTGLNIVITNVQTADYPMTLYYLRGMTAADYTYTDASSKFSVTTVGRYTLDSLKSNNGCVVRLTQDNEVAVHEYAQPVPVLTLTDKSPKTFCEGSSVNIPVTITAGNPSYKVTYTLNGNQKTEDLAASGNIELRENGPFVLKDFKDANGCGSFTPDETIDVTKNAKPAMEITSTSTQMCGGQLDLALKLSAGTAPYTITYNVDGGVAQTKEITTVGADKTAVWNITDAGTYTITKVEDQHCEIAGTDVGGGPGFTVTPLRLYVKLKNNADICASTGAEIELNFDGTVWADVKGKVSVTYEFAPADGSAKVEKTIDFEQAVAQANPVITPVPQGTYILKAVKDLGAGNCQGIMSQVESDNKIKVIDAPIVEIDSMDFALYKNEVFVLGVKNSEASKFDYEWQIDNGDFNKATTPFSIQGTMGNNDMQYVLKGINKGTPSCYNTDTVHIYKIPDAIGLDIDTNRTRNDLKLKWKVSDSEKRVIDGFTIKSSRLDAYSLISNYQEEGNVPASFESFAIDETKIKSDTLKFYYIQAYRKIKTSKGENKYFSESSDTVGFYRFDVHVNASGASEDYMAIYFDLSKIGYSKSEDIIKKLKPAVPYVYKFNFDTQEWESSYVRPNGQPLGSFDVEAGTLMKIKASTETSFLQYGKLPGRFTIELKNTNTDRFNENNGFMMLQRLDLKDATAFFNEFNTVRYIYYWNFINQEWISAQRRPNGTVQGSFLLRGLMPLKFVIQEGANNVIWK